MKNLTFPKLSLSMAVLALLAVFGLAGCGGGGSDQSSSSTPTNTVNAVINQSGGQVALNDGSIATFDPGIVKDGTAVTIITLPPEASTSTEISSLSSRVSISLPIDALMASGSLPDAGITISIPISGGVTSPASAAVSVNRVPGVVGQSYRYVEAKLSADAASVIYYGKVGITATSIAAKIYHAQMVSFRNSAVASAQNALAKNYVVVAVVKQFSPFVPTAGQLLKIQKNGSSGILSTFSTDYSFVDSSADKLLPNSGLPLGKIPLVLVHGIQATPGAACDGGAEAYKTAWEQFIIFFFSSQGQALQDKYQLYTFSYQTDLHIEGNGLLLASILKDTFGNVPTVIVAHSMGGLVTRSAIVQHAIIGAQIRGVITLGTPHHGTKVVNTAAAIVDSFSCLFATGSPGADDLKWDNFDDPSPSKTCGNSFLCGTTGINTADTPSNYTKYIPYAGVWDPSSPVCAAYLIGGLPALIFDATTYGMCFGASKINLTSDGMVPEVSARFTDFTGGQYHDKQPWSAKSRTYQGINHASIHDDPKIFSQNPDDSNGGIVQDLLDFYVSLPPPATPTDTTPPSIPIGVSASAGNGQTTISWSSASGATSYNIYWSTTSSVSKTNGTKISNATSPYMHTGRTNSTTYYYVITAVNSYGESIESSQVSATPQASLTGGGFTISGLVLDENNNRINNAVVELVANGIKYSATSDSTGSYYLHLDNGQASYLPPTFAVNAYEPTNHNPSSKGFRLSDGNIVVNNFVLLTISGNPQLVTIELVSEVHHIGNSSFSGSQNSQFQFPSAEGITFTRSLSISAAQKTYTNADITFIAKGVQCADEIWLNASKVGVLQTSDINGAFTSYTVPFDPSILIQGVNNTFQFKSVACGGSDIDDLEFSNVQINFHVSPITPAVFLDDQFNGTALDTSLWTPAGNSVTVLNGIVDLRADVTDNTGKITTTFAPKQHIRIEMRHWMHAANAYFFPRIHLHATNPDGFVGVRWLRSAYSPDYCDNPANFNRVQIFSGTGGNCTAAYSNLVSSDYYDLWITSIIDYDSVTGLFTLDNDGDGTIDFSTTVAATNRYPITLAYIDGYGWWTGHSHQIDYIKMSGY